MLPHPFFESELKACHFVKFFNIFHFCKCYQADPIQAGQTSLLHLTFYWLHLGRNHFPNWLQQDLISPSLNNVPTGTSWFYYKPSLMIPAILLIFVLEGNGTKKILTHKVMKCSVIFLAYLERERDLIILLHNKASMPETIPEEEHSWKKEIYGFQFNCIVEIVAFYSYYKICWYKILQVEEEGSDYSTF